MAEAASSRTTKRSARGVGSVDSIGRASTQADKVELTARWILQEFDAYYVESRHIPALAKDAFERRDPQTSLALSKRRLSVYSISIAETGARLRQVFPGVAQNEQLWDEVETRYLPFIAGRYEADLAFAYINSVRRKIYQGEWKPVEYSFSDYVEIGSDFSAEVCRKFAGGARVTPEQVADILVIPDFSIAYANLARDAALIARRVNQVIENDHGDRTIEAMDVIDAGFYRNRGCYIVGRIAPIDAPYFPFILALLNSDSGIYVDALLNTEADAHNIFSSTLANFHVTNTHYHELATFLHSIMPKRPLGLHYSTIGFNHVGKVAVMNELKRDQASTQRLFGTSVGFKGTVAISFYTPGSAYNLKVIRDKPTPQYKWGEFDGIDAVLRKYGQVHEINRTGSMLDNVIYYNLKLDKDWFGASLLEELLQDASLSVSRQGGAVIFKHLIVQRRMTPLPIFLETASQEDAESAIINMGFCIKNNAAANIFNKDLDARNYGVSRFQKVYLYDYDALEPFTEVKIRTNEDRVDGEEDVPDWYFEDGVVFLPEEIEAGLRIPSRRLRRLFREVHGDLLTTDYWEGIQADLRAGKVPGVRIYSESRKLAQG